MQLPAGCKVEAELDEGELYAALENFVTEHQVELIVVNTYKRRVLAKLFNPTMARRMLFHAGTPILVMHSNSSQYSSPS